MRSMDDCDSTGAQHCFLAWLTTTRRGIVGMAHNGKRNTNASQFFITLDKADELSNKHTMFGKVTGNTIFSESRW